RCGTAVEQRHLEQWFFRITAYADRLLDNLEGLDWTARVKHAQRRWIGRSTGVDVSFAVEGHPDVKISTFTTRPETLYGASFIALAPDHPDAPKLNGASALNPTNGERLPIFTADYVLSTYGTAA